MDTVADNASSGRLVLGGRLTDVTDLDLSVVGMVISRNGALLHTGAGAAVLGNPARCVSWLANKLASFGAALHSGDVVLSGAPAPAGTGAARRCFPGGVRPSGRRDYSLQ